MKDAPDRFLGYGRQNIDENDIEAVTDALRSDHLTQGPFTRKFEQALRETLDVPFVTACSSGTTALHMAALAMGLGPGDAVIVPAMTFAATANAVLYTGATVVFADCDPDNGLMNIPQVEDAIVRVPANKTLRAVFCVHMNGQCSDMPALYAFCQAKGLHLLEDACHAIGTTYGEDHKIGSCRHSDVAVFSFHPVKTIAMGEGGAVMTRNPDFGRQIALLVTHGITRDPAAYIDQSMAAAPWYHEMQILGYNYRASDIHCALGLSQWKKLNFFSSERRRLMDIYTKALTPLAPALRMIARTNCSPVFHLNAVLIDFERAGLNKTRLMMDLKERQIGTQVHYIPVYQHPYYRALYPDHPILPGAERYYRDVLSLPLFVGMTEQDVDYVAATLQDLLWRNA